MVSKKKGTFPGVKNYFEESLSDGPIFSFEEKTFSEWKRDRKESKKEYFVLKDNFWSKGIPTTSSSLFLKSFFPMENSTVLTLLIENGYKLLGKSYLDEFACGGLGIFSCEGVISNPHNKKRAVGGSSSGSAFSVANGIVSFAIGHDAGDSVRRPSSYCGIIGFKPSYGSISRYGIIPMASSFDTVGIMSKDIGKIKEIYEKISKIDYKDITTVAFSKLNSKPIGETKKVAVFKNLQGEISDRYFEIYRKKIQAIEEKGLAKVEEIVIPETIRENLQISYLILCSSEVTSHLNSLNGITYGCKDSNKATIKSKRSSFIGKWAKERIIVGSYFLKEKDLIKKASNFRIFVTEWLKEIFKNYDFLLFPGTESIAPEIKESENNNIKKSKWVDNLMLLSNLAGNPSINIPLGKVNEMPISLNIDSPWKNERDLLNFTSKLLCDE